MPLAVGRGAGKNLRHAAFSATALPVIVIMAAFLKIAPASAAPFLPSSDDIVLEHLPDTGGPDARALRASHRALAADPTDLKLAVDVARRDLDRSRALGDPRYLGRAEAALAVWPVSNRTPPDVLLLRAVILQSNHDFAGALALLHQLVEKRRGDAQAWLTMAAVHQAQSNYPDAIADCGQVAALTLGLAPDVCTATAMSMTGHATLALHAVALSLATNAAEAACSAGVAVWATTLAAEIAARLDDPSAETWFARALAIDPTDPYLLGAWADWLLDHARPQDVVALLGGATRIDPLLLRLAIAEQATANPSAAGHVRILQERFDASRLRGDTVHRREEARFTLALLHNPASALTLAAANWRVQREPADARILLEAALATRRPDAAAPVLAWMRQNGVEDRHLAALAAQIGRS